MNLIVFSLFVEKRKRGAPKRAESLKREDELKKYANKLVQNGKLVSSGEEIYEMLGKKFGVTSQTIYLQSKRLFQTRIEQTKYKGDEAIDTYQSLDYEHTFDLNVKDDDLVKRFVETNAYLRGIRSYFRVIIVQYSYFTCHWHFDVCCSKEHTIFCAGSCTHPGCSGQVFITSNKDRSILNIKLKGFTKNIVHVKKSRTTGAHKDRIEQLLKVNTPYVTRSLLAAAMCDEGGEDMCLLPTTKTLTTQKYRMKLKETESYLDADPVLALVKMKTQLETLKTIHNVAISPFYVTYSTPTQAALVKSQKRRSRIIFSMDATGVSVRLSPLASKSDRTDKTKRCFLYVITLHENEGRSLPIYQMLSQDHSSIQISMMLKTCSVENNHVKPNEVIIDQSAAFLLAILQSYTSYKSVHQYLDRCYELLETERIGSDSSDISDDDTFYVRFDRSHVCKTYQQSKDLTKGVHKQTSTFYKRLLGYLIQEPSISNCEKIIRNMFIILNNQYLSEDVRNIMKELEMISAHHKIDQATIEREYDLPDSSFEVEFSDTGNKPKNKFNRWILEMAENAKCDAQNESLDENVLDKNPYFADTLEKPLIKFISQLPLSGNIMNKVKRSVNEIPTSSPTETDFDVLKNDLFRGSNGIRVDSFVNKHLTFTKGRLIGKRVNDVRAELFDDQSQDENFTNAELESVNTETQDQSQDESFENASRVGTRKHMISNHLSVI